MSSSDSSRPVPPATLYLASPEDAEAGRLDVAGLPVAFRALMSALHAGCPSVAVPAAYRGTEVDRAIGRSGRARAHTVWLDGDNGEAPREPMLLLPATVILSPVALRALLEVPPVAVIDVSPPEAPVVLADASLLAAVEPQMATSPPAGATLRLTGFLRIDDCYGGFGVRKLYFPRRQPASSGEVTAKVDALEAG